jgi:hypothetical protein
MKGAKPMKRIAIAVLSFSIGSGAVAANLEYGHEYEAAFLQQCAREHNERTCRCSMQTLQTRIGFEKFAELAERRRHEVTQSEEARMAEADLLARCSAIGSLQ